MEINISLNVLNQIFCNFTLIKTDTSAVVRHMCNPSNQRLRQEELKFEAGLGIMKARAMRRLKKKCYKAF
jgi:hypothetical protein